MRNVLEAAQGTANVSGTIVKVSEAAQQTDAAAMRMLRRPACFRQGALKVRVQRFLRDVRSA